MPPDGSVPPSDVLDLYLAAIDLIDAGDPDAAVLILERAVDAEPSTRMLRQALAQAQYDAGSYASAADSFAYLVAAQPSDADAHYGLGMACRRLGRNDEAVDALSRAAALRPDLKHYADALHEARSMHRGGRQ